jgi:diguanylate cyclase (GGDEF)-like protein
VTLPLARCAPGAARRTTVVWGLALLLLGAGVRAGAIAAVRVSAASYRPLYVALALACFALAAAVWVAGAGLPARLRYLLLVVTSVVTTVLVATAPRSSEVVLTAFAYPWAAVYAAHVLPRRVAFTFAGIASASFAIGISVVGWAGLVGAWVMVTMTVLLATAVTSAVVCALRNQSETDALTGVANRAGFHRLSALTLASADRRWSPVALVLCDLDGLKQVNDSGGHAAGDALLVDVVVSWSRVLRRGDVLARIGGDEFAVLLPDTDLEGAEHVVERLYAATKTPFSAGAATRLPGESLSELLMRADAAMYARKGGHQPSALAMRSFMTSVAPPPIPRMRASR